MQSAIIPSMAKMKKMIINNNTIQKFFETMVMLPFIASKALRFPKIIKGIITSVNNGTRIEIKPLIKVPTKIKFSINFGKLIVN